MKCVNVVFVMRYIKTFCLLVFISITPNVGAQNSALEALLKEYPEVSPSISPIYTEKSKTEITSVDFSGGFQIVREEANWAIIQFNAATVPLWVSSDFIERKGNVARIRVKRLNARIKPTLSSLKVTQVYLDYQAVILDSRDGFVRIKVPASRVVAIKRSQLASLNQFVSKKEQVVTTAVNKSKVNPASVLVERADGAPQPLLLSNVESTENLHIIAPGDAISLLVFGEPDLSVENLRVPESGRVSLPLIGSVVVGGQTTKQVEAQIRTILASGYVKNPRLSVSIFSYRPIFIRGAVVNTGAFPFSEDLSVSKAIALSGGAKNSAKENSVSILRDGVIVEEGLSLDSQQSVISGDVITVGEELGVSDDENLFIYLHGEISSPGEYRYRRGLTIEKAIVLAGGFTLRASRKKISITRYEGVDDGQEPISLKKVKLYTPIMPGDVIRVKASLF